MTNKTLTSPVIGTIVNTGTLTLPTSTDTLVGRATTDTLTNKSLTNASVFHVDGTDTTKRVAFATSGATTGTTSTITGVQTANRALTLPDATTTLVGTDTTQTLTNKTLTNASTFHADGTDATKRLIFQTSGATTGTTLTLSSAHSTTKTLNIPNATANDTFITDTFAQTLSNKTLTAPVIATIVNTGMLTLPTSTDTLVGRATTDTLTNKFLTNASVIFADGTDNTKRLAIQTSGATTATQLTLASAHTTTKTLNIPNATTGDTFVTDNFTQTLTNKTFTSPVINTPTLTVNDAANFTIQNAGDITKKVRFDLASITTGTTRTLTVPDITDTIVTLVATQTLTNKTFSTATSFTNVTDATSISTGSIITSGGIGAAKNIYSGTGLFLPFGTAIVQFGAAATQTTDATVTTLYNSALTTSTIGKLIYFQVHAYNTTDNQSGTYSGYVKAINVGGTVTVSSIAQYTTILDISMSTTAITVDVSGTNVRIRATGVAAKTINWTGTATETRSF